MPQLRYHGGPYHTEGGHHRPRRPGRAVAEIVIRSNTHGYLARVPMMRASEADPHDDRTRATAELLAAAPAMDLLLRAIARGIDIDLPRDGDWRAIAERIGWRELERLAGVEAPAPARSHY